MHSKHTFSYTQVRLAGWYPQPMSINRRNLLALMSAPLMTCAATRASSARSSPIRAIAFDAFVLFDPRPMVQALEAAWPGRGQVLATQFRTRVFDYCWLRALGHRYEDFWSVSAHALDAALRAEGLDAPGATRTALLETWGTLPPWPDTVNGVRRLACRGYALAALSNWSPRMLNEGLARAGLRDEVLELSTDRARSYKPAPESYALALDAFSLPRQQIAFVAFAAWDAAGASWFGFPTVWMNRTDAPRETLDADEISVARSFDDPALDDMLGGAA